MSSTFCETCLFSGHKLLQPKEKKKKGNGYIKKDEL